MRFSITTAGQDRLLNRIVTSRPDLLRGPDPDADGDRLSPARPGDTYAAGRAVLARFAAWSRVPRAPRHGRGVTVIEVPAKLSVRTRSRVLSLFYTLLRPREAVSRHASCGECEETG